MTWGQLGDNLITAAKRKGIPLLGQFELTARCNLHCKMCYVCQPANDNDALRRERTTKEWIQLIMEARDAGMLYPLITGGEVFLRQDFRTIYEEISQMGLMTQINTNATMITPEIASWLGRIPPAAVTITLYGASSDTYGKVCGDSSGYQRTLRGISLLQSEGINFDLRTTVVRGNKNEFNELAELAEKFGVTLGLVNYIMPRREGNNTCPEAERLSPIELIHYELNAEEYYIRREKESLNHKCAVTVDQDQSLARSEEYLLEQETKPFSCTSANCNFCVTWDGRMVPCVLMAEPFTSPFEKKFINAWDELKRLCSKIPSCDECMHCSSREVCMSCPASLKSETGYYDKAAPYLCELAGKKKEIQENSIYTVCSL